MQRVPRQGSCFWGGLWPQMSKRGAPSPGVWPKKLGACCYRGTISIATLLLGSCVTGHTAESRSGADAFCSNDLKSSSVLVNYLGKLSPKSFYCVLPFVPAGPQTRPKGALVHGKIFFDFSEVSSSSPWHLGAEWKERQEASSQSLIFVSREYWPQCQTQNRPQR